MLHAFIAEHRDAIISRTRERLGSRSWPSVSTHELEHGVPLFLTQLSETLRLEAAETPFPSGAIGSSAARHGQELLAMGFNVSQVVHDYGDICQAVTELAVERKAPITVQEFHTLNRCLDTAIAEAVTEHARLTAQARSAEEGQHFGRAAHELRDVVDSAVLAFHMLKQGEVSINGSTGAVLGRSLISLRDIIDRNLSEARLAADNVRCERLPVVTLLDDVAVAAVLHAEYRAIRFRVEEVDPVLAVDGDRQLLSSAVMNLLHNAFKYTPVRGRVVLRAHAKDRQLLIEVEDECGGMLTNQADMFQAFGDRRASDRSGLGLGLSVARTAMRTQGGDISARNIPGKGCVFTIEMPLTAEDGAAS